LRAISASDVPDRSKSSFIFSPSFNTFKLCTECYLYVKYFFVLVYL
jgi:hypothetical protein